MSCTLLVSLSLSLFAADEKLYRAEPLPAQGFNELIEGPACDAAGNIYAVGFGPADNIARVTPEGKAANCFSRLPNKSIGNGIVFDQAGQMYVADYTNHNVLKIDPQTKSISVLAP